MPITYACPYFSWEDKATRGLTVNCEGAKLKFSTREERDGYVYAYCANCPGWELCSIAGNLNKRYDET